MITSFQDLSVYKRSKELFQELSKVVVTFPKDQSYLRSQMLRAANSIHSNIAEGYGRSDAEFKQYLRRALGSGNEILSHLEDAKTVRSISKKDFENLFSGYTILGKQLYVLRERWVSKN